MTFRLMALAGVLLLQGCFVDRFRKPKEPPPPPALTPKPLPPITSSNPPADPVIEPPPTTTQAENPATIPIRPAPNVSAPKPGSRRARNESAAQQQRQSEKKPAAPKTQPVPAPATVPRLGEILSPEVRASYERDYAAHVARAQEILTQAAGRNLDSNQEQSTERIRAFLLQAEEIRERGDLSNALEIARRASLLADDLIRTFR